MDPLNPSLRPPQTTPAPRPEQAPEPKPDAVDLSQRLEKGGGELSLRRRVRLPFMAPEKRLEAEEAARLLEQGGQEAERLRVTPAGLEAPLPIRTVADLQEAVAFQEGQPPADAGALPRLAAQGWRFFAEVEETQAEVGLYGAYNALTDPGLGLSGLEARREGIRVGLGDADSAHSLADFTDDPARGGETGPLLADLEARGYRFYEATGREHGAFEASGVQGYAVGRDGEAWFPLAHLDPDRADKQLDTFAGFLALEGDANGALALWDELRAGSRPALDPDRLSSLVAGGRNLEETRQRANLVVEALADRAGSPAVSALASAAVDAAPTPEVVKAMLGRWTESDPVAFASAVFSAAPEAGRPLLGGLGDLPAAAIFGAAVDAQAGEANREATMQAFFANPRADLLDLACTAIASMTARYCGSQERQDAAELGVRVLESQRTSAADFARALLAPLEGASRLAVLAAWLSDPSRSDASALARMAAGLALHGFEAAEVGRAALEQLASHAPFARTAQRALATLQVVQKDETRAAVARMALQDLGEVPDATFALRAMEAITAGSSGYHHRDDAARVGVDALKRLQPAPAGVLGLKLAGKEAQYEVSRAFLAHAEASTPEELLEPVRQAVGRMYASIGIPVAQGAVEQYQDHPAFRETFARALRGVAQVEKDEAKFAVLKLALADPEGKRLPTLDRFAAQAMEAITAGSSGYHYRPDATRLGMDALQALSSQPGAGLALELAGTSEDARYELARAFLPAVAAATPEELLEPVRQAIGRMYASTGSPVAQAAVERFQDHPPFRDTFGRARRAVSLVEKEEPKFAILRMALGDPEGKGFPSEETFALQAMASMVSGSSGYHYREDAARVGMAALESLKDRPAAEFALALARQSDSSRFSVAVAFLPEMAATKPEELVAPAARLVAGLHGEDGASVAKEALERLAAHPPFADLAGKVLQAAEPLKSSQVKKAVLQAALEDLQAGARRDDLDLGLRLLSAVTSLQNSYHYSEDSLQLALGALEAARRDPASEPAASFALEVAPQDPSSSWVRLRLASVALATARETGREAMFARAVEALKQCGSSAGSLLGPTVRWLAARPELSMYRPGLEGIAGRLTPETKPAQVIAELLALQKLARDTEGFVDRATGKGERGPAIQEDEEFVQIGPIRLPRAPRGE